MAVRTKKIPMSGWGNFPTTVNHAFRPEWDKDISEAIALQNEAPRKATRLKLIARGAGRSYGDQSLPVVENGAAILTERLDRLVAFDDGSGELVVEAGVSFATLLRIFLPRGWLIPVTPGTAFATVGGAVANDVHGKNHDDRGSFGDQILWLDLMLASGEIKRLKPNSVKDRQVFAATIGGCGLTGVILRICLRLDRLVGASFMVEKQRVKTLDEFIEQLESVRSSAAYSVGWIDALASGRSFGRGILETVAKTAAQGTGKLRSTSETESRRIQIPNLPISPLNPVTVALFNNYRYFMAPKNRCESLVSIENFLYPLDGLLNWNRLYGKRGFQQFQCVIPSDSTRIGLREILTTITKSNAASPLAVIKTLGNSKRVPELCGMIAFPLKGVTLAVDIARSRDSDRLFTRLADQVIDYGGRVYLAKDSALTAQQMAAMYPRLSEFRSVLHRYDPDGVFASLQSQRLNLRGDK